MTKLDQKIMILVPAIGGEWETHDGPFPTKQDAVRYAETMFGNRPRPGIMIVEQIDYLNPIPE